MKKNYRKIAVLLTAIMVLMVYVPNSVYATRGLELEKGHEWVISEYSYAYASSVGDVDGDGVTEIVTVGSYHNETIGCTEGVVDIWTWNGTDLALEHREYYEMLKLFSFDTRLYDVALGNVDNDTDTEIVMVGYGNFLSIQEQGLLIVAGWNGTAFRTENFTYWPLEEETMETKAYSVAINDVDKDNTTEIITVGYENTTTIFGTGFHGQLVIWNKTEENLVQETSYEWFIGDDAYWRSVAVDDLDLDGELEIIIAGHFRDEYLGCERALLKICTWNGTVLWWKASNLWYTYSDTYAYDVATEDLDSDGKPEIVTIGSHYDGEAFYAQLRIWSYEQNLLTLKLSVEGGVVGLYGFSQGKTVTIDDIDNDGTKEIITGINLGMFLFPIGTSISIFSWNGNSLTIEDAEDWNNATSIEDIVTDDVDNDGITEIITVGYYTFMIPSKSELGIWSVSKVASRITVTLSSSTIVIGNQVTITGQLTNETDETPIPNAEVTLEYSHEGGAYIPLGTVTTDENGEYKFTWIPPAPGNYIIRASWKGDYEHENAADTTSLTVEKASSLIALTLSSYTAKIGDTINVDGMLYPAKAATITIEYKMPNGTISIKTVDSNNEGAFSDTFTVDQTGNWSIKASWTGDNTYKGTESSTATVSVSKIQSTISVSASALTVNVGEDVTISGTLTPGQSATITLTYTKPDGTTTTKDVASNSAGVFTDTITLDQAGTWQVKASWNGNTQYEAAVSAPITITAQAVDTTTSMFAITGLGLGLIALIIALIGVYMATKKKTGTQRPPPSPQPPTTETPPPQA